METLSLDSIGLKYNGQSKNNKYAGGDKTSVGQNFTEFYDKAFSHLRNCDIKFMEIGVFNGKSLAMWSDYFVNGTIYGIEINLKTWYAYLDTLKKDGAFKSRILINIIPSRKKTENYRFELRNDIKLIECDTFTETFAQMVHNNFGEFDIILDDGNHTAKYQYHNFDLLFDSLKPKGIYVIEDIEDPYDLYSFNGFGFIVNGVTNPRKLNIENMRKEYVDKLKQKNAQEYEILGKKIGRIDISLTKTPSEDVRKRMVESRENYETRMKQLEPLIQDVGLIGCAFDAIIDRKNHLIELIDHIEIRRNNIMIYKK